MCENHTCVVVNSTPFKRTIKQSYVLGFSLTLVKFDWIIFHINILPF